jgi:hypothetical protein
MKNLSGIVLRFSLIAAFLFNAAAPSAGVLAAPQNKTLSAEQLAANAGKRVLTEQSQNDYKPPEASQAALLAQAAASSHPSAMIAGQPSFSITAFPGVVNINDTVTITVTLYNPTRDAQTSIQFVDDLENGVEFVADPTSPVTYDSARRAASHTIAYLEAGNSISFAYMIKITSKKAKTARGEARIRVAKITYVSGASISAPVSIGVATDLARPDGNLAAVEPQGGWHELGKVSVHLEPAALAPDSLLSADPLTPVSDREPKIQYKLDILRSAAIIEDAQGNPIDQEVDLVSSTSQTFADPAILSFDLTGNIDLSAIPAGQEVYVATYDETNRIWIKVPIIAKDLRHDTLSVQAAHFSTWGVGLGSALPQNGANVLLFDQPFTSLFTGAAQYSIPIWMPKGRNGMAPSVSLGLIPAALITVYWVISRRPGWVADGTSMGLKSFARSPPAIQGMDTSTATP